MSFVAALVFAGAGLVGVMGVGCGGGGAGGADAGADAAIDAAVDAGDDAGAVDAAPVAYDDSCALALWPTEAPQAVRVAGVVMDVSGVPVEGAGVELRQRMDDALLAQGTTQTGGAFDLQPDAVPPGVATGGVPLDAVLSIQAAGAVLLRWLPPAPLAADEIGRTFVVRTEGELEALYAAAGVTLDPGAATLWIHAADCAGADIPGLTVSLNVEAPVVSLGAQDEVFVGSSVTGVTGRVVGLNVPAAAGTVKVQASAGGHGMRVQAVRVVAGAITQIELRP